MSGLNPQWVRPAWAALLWTRQNSTAKKQRFLKLPYRWVVSDKKTGPFRMKYLFAEQAVVCAVSGIFHRVQTQGFFGTESQRGGVQHQFQMVGGHNRDQFALVGLPSQGGQSSYQGCSIVDQKFCINAVFYPHQQCMQLVEVPWVLKSLQTHRITQVNKCLQQQKPNHMLLDICSPIIVWEPNFA